MNVPNTEIPAAKTYRFHDFELDLTEYRLTLRGEPVRIERRPFELLALLVARPAQLITREELIAALWPSNVIIDFDAGLNTLVRKVRQALEDSSDAPRYIETVPGRGYRFIGAVEDPPAIEPSVAASAGIRIRPARRLPALATIGAGLLVIGVGLGIWLTSAQPPKVPHIAVLPFENLTGLPDLGYLASGLAEETSASLARIEPDRLRVIGDVSAKALAEPGRTWDFLNRELGVDFIVRSSLQVDGTRLRVNSRLIRVIGNQLVWSASFDRERTSLLGLQRELSMAIAEQVRLKLSADVAREIDRRQTRNPEAYQLYLKGRFSWGQFTPAALRDALDYYRSAIRKDPSYALAWAGIAQALAVGPMTADIEPLTIAESARDAAERAMQYGSDLSEANYALGYVRLFLDWDAAAAEQAARAAVAMGPNNALAQMFLGVVLSHNGQSVEALAAMRRARELDPLFAQTFALSSMVSRNSGDLAAAVDFARQAIAVSPEGWVGYLHLGSALLAMGEDSAALQAFSDAERLSGGNSKALAARATTLIRLNRREEARAVMGQLEAAAAHRYVPPYALAVVHAGLGQTDMAFDWLERALSSHDVHLLGFDLDPFLESLRQDARFERLRNRAHMNRASL